MRLTLVLSVVGHVLRPFSLAFVAPAGLALAEHNTVSAVRFGIGGFIALIAGLLLSTHKADAVDFRRDEAMAVVALTWLLVAICGGTPYLMYGLSWDEALFEAMSGFTTTGATILTDFSVYDRPFFLWRALTQWFGGLGVIALFILVLPRLGIAGRQLFFAEASGAPGEAVSPQIRSGARRLWILYGALTVLLALLLRLFGGMSGYDAILHSLTTLSAGGFSPNGMSIAGYESNATEWILSVFMLLAGASFTLQYKVFTGSWLAWLKDGEFCLYSGLMLVIAVTLTLVLPADVALLDRARLAVFQTTSVMSSTGFASVDYNLWADPARALLIIAMLVGGCAGSAAGGAKVVRLLLVFKHVHRELRTTLHPRAVLAIRYKGEPVSREIMRSVFTMVALFMLGHFVVGTALVLMGSDLVLGYSAALACLGNIGPGFGAAGPMGNFQEFSAAAKVLLTVAMWIGRLEIVTVLALLHPDVMRGLLRRG